MKLKDKKILIVEDNFINQHLMRAQLKDQKAILTFAFDGIEALEKIKQEKFDLIFMDIQLPGMNGFDTTIEIRKININTPIIALTSTELEGDEFYKFGMNDYIIKPADTNKILEIIYKHI